MAYDDCNLKEAAEKRYKSPVGMGGQLNVASVGVGPRQAQDTCAQQPAEGRPKGETENVLDNLSRRAMRAEHEHKKIDEVLNILSVHPEFIDFLTVLRSGLV